jgi:hypothetical protein
MKCEQQLVNIYVIGKVRSTFSIKCENNLQGEVISLEGMKRQAVQH